LRCRSEALLRIISCRIALKLNWLAGAAFPPGDPAAAGAGDVGCAVPALDGTTDALPAIVDRPPPRQGRSFIR
jgi:hypothetical protein